VRGNPVVDCVIDADVAVVVVDGCIVGVRHVGLKMGQVGIPSPIVDVRDGVYRVIIGVLRVICLDYVGTIDGSYCHLKAGGRHGDAYESQVLSYIFLCIPDRAHDMKRARV